MHDLTVTRWRRYGKDRLYVSTESGTRVDWTDLAANQPGQAAREQALAHRRAAPVKTLMQRAFGVRSDERAWRIGADGERKVAAVLQRLPGTWNVLHAVPVGTRGSDIDHIAIGPGGVFTINAKHHPGAAVWVGGPTFLVNGQPQPYVRNARHEADRATRLLSAATGFAVPVTGVIAVICGEVTVRAQPDDVAVVGRKRLAAWLTKQDETLTDEQVAAVFTAARRSTTWQ